MKKKSVIIGSAIVILVIIVGTSLYLMMQQGLYQPGLLAKDKTIIGDYQINASADYFNVEQDVKLYKFEQGRADLPVILVIHGGPCAPYSKPWSGNIELSNKFRFIYYHQRGCGLSSNPYKGSVEDNFYNNMKLLDKKLGISSQLADVERIRRILKTKQIILMGHSFGAFLATLYAIEFPDKVKSLILVSPADMVVFPLERDLFDEIQDQLPIDLFESYQTFRASYFDFSNLFNKSTAELESLHNEFSKYYTIALSKVFQTNYFSKTKRYKMNWMPFALYFGLGKKHDFSDSFSSLKLPVLVLHGQYDLQPESVSRKFSNYLSNSTFKVIKNTSHFSFEENPNQFAESVSRFLKEK